MSPGETNATAIYQSRAFGGEFFSCGSRDRRDEAVLSGGSVVICLNVDVTSQILKTKKNGTFTYFKIWSQQFF
jgi:hypothetical protein